ICLASPKKVDTSRLTTVESELKSEINSFNCCGRCKRVHAGRSLLVKATCARTFATHASATDMKMSITLRFRENTRLKNDKRMSPTIKDLGVEEIGISLVNICSFFHKDGWLDFERLVVKTVVVGPVNMTKLTVPL
ncbi:hypothetical protein ScalyP_jg330, partial [Parmales sp. scaly parma]